MVIPLRPRSGWGYIGFNWSVHLSVWLSGRLWTNSLCILYNNSWFHIIVIHLIRQLQKVCHVSFFLIPKFEYLPNFYFGYICVSTAVILFPRVHSIFHSNYQIHFIFIHLIKQPQKVFHVLIFKNKIHKLEMLPHSLLHIPMAYHVVPWFLWI